MDFEKFDQDVEKLQCASTFEDIFYQLRTFTASGKFVEMMIMYEVLGDQRCDVDLDKRVQIHGERRRPKLRDLLSSDGHSPQAHVDPIRDHIIGAVAAAAGMTAPPPTMPPTTAAPVPTTAAVRPAQRPVRAASGEMHAWNVDRANFTGLDLGSI